MNTMKKLLVNISKAAGRTAFSNADKDEFNIFRVLGVQTKEVIICRFIGELLDPNGAHKMGIKPLESFFWYKNTRQALCKRLSRGVQYKPFG